MRTSLFGKSRFWRSTPIATIVPTSALQAIGEAIQTLVLDNLLEHSSPQIAEEDGRLAPPPKFQHDSFKLINDYDLCRRKFPDRAWWCGGAFAIEVFKSVSQAIGQITKLINWGGVSERK